MKHEISVEGGIILLVVSGEINPEDYILAANAIVNMPQWKPGMKILIDYSHVDFSKENGSNSEFYAKAIIPHKTALGDGRCACVNINPSDYGLGRIWQVFMESYTNLRVGIFYTYEEAMNWLSESNQQP